MSFIGSFWGRRDTQQVSRDAIVGLRQQLQMIGKKEEHIQKQIEEQTQTAKKNAVSNRMGEYELRNLQCIGVDWFGTETVVATGALKQRKILENNLDKLQGSRFQLEAHVNTLESAKMNQETMAAMKKAADALKHIHGGMWVLIPSSPMIRILIVPAIQEYGQGG